MITKTINRLLCLGLLALSFPAGAQYSVDWFTIDGGGRSSTGAVYSITGTIGQPDAGVRMNGIYFSVDGGFWSFLAPQQEPSFPGVQLAGVTNIAGTTATFMGLVNPGNLPTQVYFEWGTTTSYGNRTTTNFLAGNNVAFNVSLIANGLPPTTVIHYRLVAINSAGVSYSSDAVFTTILATGGTWTPLAHAPPGPAGHMHLLSDGTVLAEDLGGSYTGPGWFRLTPDIHGSYVNGTWSSIAPMHQTRLDFASQVLRDGRLFVAGGEYGDGSNAGEVYNPLTDTWTMAPDVSSLTQNISDAPSMLLPDGKVLVGPVNPYPVISTANGYVVIYDPVANSWSKGANYARGKYNQDEASWVKLADGSILTVDFASTNSERYIPSLGQWVADANVPVALYDPYGTELGAGLLLPDGRAFFLGASGHTAIYTPSGSTSAGVWVAGPDIPNGQGTPDAPAAMMVNGKILCVTVPVPTAANEFNSPISFYEYDYVNNSFTRVNAPGNALTFPDQSWPSLMLDLPDGSVLFTHRSIDLYVYRPVGPSIAAGKPAITSITTNLDGSFHLVGSGLNGISSGAAYGDDEQEDSNYPLVRLTNANGEAYYCRTYNWSDTSVMTGNKPVSTEFSVPAGVPLDAYQLVVVANGLASDPVPFTGGFPLKIVPTSPFSASGFPGGPFSPGQQTCFLTNVGTSSLTWTAAVTVPWLTLTSSGGVLSPGATASVSFAPNAVASQLDFGTYTGIIWFTNLTDGTAQQRSFQLQVISLIQNGGFETVYSGTYANEPVGWTFVAGSTANSFALGGPGASPHSGNYLMAFGQSGYPAVLRQVVPTTPGQLYLLSLWLESDGSTPSAFQVSWNGVSLYQTNNPPAELWTNLRFLVTASGPASVLDLAGRDDYSLLGVDDVSLLPVPTPIFQSAALSGNSFALSWNAQCGVHYQVQTTTNLAQPNWQNVGLPITATNSLGGMVEPVGAEAQRFFRVLPVP